MHTEKPHILIADTNLDTFRALEIYLKREGYSCHWASSPPEVLDKIRQTPPQILILEDPFGQTKTSEFFGQMKRKFPLHTFPTILIPHQASEDQVLDAFEMGIDDVVPQPFSPRVVCARVRALLRRYQLSQPSIENDLRFQDLEIYPKKHIVLLHKKPLALTKTEFKTLHFLAQRMGWAFTRNQILKAVHGDTPGVTDRSIDVQIVGLRKKLGSYGKSIETVRGVGYRFNKMLGT